MSYEIMPYISLAMFAMLFYCFSLIRFIAPLWIILFVISSGRVATPFGLITVLAFTLVLMFFILNLIRLQQKKAAKARKGEDDSDVSIFDEEDDESNSDLPSMTAVRDEEESPKKALKPKKSRLTIYEGTLMSHGFAPYNDIPGNDKSYFVECDDKKVWGIGLKDAVKASGAETGDTVRFWKEAEVRTKKANVFDSNGKVTGTRTLSTDKRRGLWVMEKVS
ncbi:hypothetical protein AGJ33_20140 [Cronobacter dublinensis subsp. dublinensis]|nr:hypothetical protein [Cronobacter dublinensis subsp. dublinensis]